METFSALLALCAGIHRSPVNSHLKGQWLGALLFSLIYTWINAWVKQWQVWWFETTSRSLWRHCNEFLFSSDFPRNTVINVEEAEKGDTLHCDSQGNPHPHIFWHYGDKTRDETYLNLTEDILTSLRGSQIVCVATNIIRGEVRTDIAVFTIRNDPVEGEWSPRYLSLYHLESHMLNSVSVNDSFLITLWLLIGWWPSCLPIRFDFHVEKNIFQHVKFALQ